MNKRELIIFIIILIIASVMCFPYFNMHYSTDTMAIIDDGYEDYAINIFLNAGRVFSSLVTLIAGYFNLSIDIFVIGLFCISLVISCMSIMEIRKIIIIHTKNLNIWKEILIIAISYNIIFNFMYLELMYFAEAPIMALSIWFYIKSAKNIVDKKYIKGIIFLIIGELCYQGTMSFFIVFIFVLLIIKYKKVNINVIKVLTYAAIFCIIAVALNMVQIKICGEIFNMQQNRLGTITNMYLNILWIIGNMNMIIINSSDIFPKYLFITFESILLGVLYWDSLRNNNKDTIINILWIVVVAIASIVVINMFSVSSFGTGRMSISIGALIGLIYMYIYSTTDIFEEKSILKYILEFVFTIYFIINFLNYTILMYENIKANKLDENETHKINQYILNYEKENNIQIAKIEVYYDENADWCHNRLNHKSLFTHRRLMVRWSNVRTINYYTNRNLQQIDANKETYNKYFKGKDWNELNEEQFVFVNDTLYYCVY